MITAEQVRAALGALRWSRRELSERTGVSARTIQRLVEATGVPNTNARILVVVCHVLETGTDEVGIEFLNLPEPGIKIVYKQAAE